jgi:hypothetical protein
MTIQIAPHVLALYPHLSCAKIAERIGVRATSVHRVVNRMLERGEIQPPPTPDPPTPVSPDGHRWDVFGRYRTCLDCQQRQFVGARRMPGEFSSGWVPAMDACVRKRSFR